MNLQLRFSPATPADLPALNRLVNRAYRGEASKQGWTTEAALLAGQRTDEADLHEQLEKPGAQFLLARRATDAELVGSVFLHQQGPELYLGMLSVEPMQQAGGIGRQLVQAAEIHARARGCHAVRMTVISIRHELIAWYERLGYQRTTETVAFPTDPRFGVPLQTEPLVLQVLRKAVSE